MTACGRMMTAERMVTLSTFSSDMPVHTQAVDVTVVRIADLCVLDVIKQLIACGSGMKDQHNFDVGVGELVLGKDIAICLDRRYKNKNHGNLKRRERGMTLSR